MSPQLKSLKKNRTNDGAFFIFHSPTLNELYAEYASRDDWEKALAIVNEKRFTVKDGDVTYRVINHWMSEGLIADDRDENPKGWRKLSFKDLLWLRVLRDLRQFGLPLEKLRKTYESIFLTPTGKEAWDFDLAMALCINTSPTPVFIVVFDDGVAEIATLHSLRLTDYLVGYEQPYIRINLNTLCCEIFGNAKCMPKQLPGVDLNAVETEVLHALRDGGLDEVSIHFKDGLVSRVDKTKKVEGAQRIVDLLLETDFGELTIKVAGGKPTHTTITKKSRPKK